MIEPTVWPLSWPSTWERNRRREEATRFQVTLAQARDDLARELDLLGATRVVVSSNAILNRNGTIAARQPVLDDPGVAAWFDLDGESRVLPCDKWTTVLGNVRAIGLTVAALRGLDRWGSGQMVDAAFAGFAALPAGSGAGWWTVLGVGPDAGSAEIDAAYKRLARQHHPDTPGGDAERFRSLTEAWKQGKEATG